ncbi:MAG: hypothetical protein LBM09_00440 [Candidatus Nomurabacteria bacterium]|jgi:hypothetical protein|nr:hypothetical protein [Candidatus Nomurabacteria bacterium]
MASKEMTKLRDSLVFGTRITEGKRSINICGICKGEHCCKHSACGYAPIDFYNDDDEVDQQDVRKAIMAGIACLSTENYGIAVAAPSIEYMENRETFGDIMQHDKKRDSFGSCALLTEKGCPLDLKSRPLWGATLEPHNRRYKKCDYDKFEIAMKLGIIDQNHVGWFNQQEMLEQLRQELSEIPVVK